MSRRVVVVGAGPGGLAASLLLARAGIEVVVLERQSRVGGRTSTIEAEGFRFDVGPTFFLYPRVLEEIFASVGRNLRQEVELVRLDPQYRIVFGAGGEMIATPNIDETERQVASIAPNDARNLRRFLTDNRAKLERFRPCIENAHLGWEDVLTPRMLAVLPWLRPLRSLDEDLKIYFQDPRIRLAFSFQSKYLGMSPFTCPSLFSILSFLEYEYGVWHPIGGCGVLTATMSRIAREMGVTVRLSEPVESVIFEGRRAVGVRTASGELRADAVVLNADFARAMTTLVPEALRPGWTDAKIAGKRFSCSTFMLYLGIEGRYDRPHHSIYIAKDHVRNFGEIEKHHVLSSDPSLYVQNAAVTDPSLAPAGSSTLYVLAPVTHQTTNVDWGRERDAFRRVVVAQMTKLGFEDVEPRIRFERVFTPADWDRHANIHLGATFHLAHNLGQVLHLRPRNRFEGVDGLYLVGGGTHPGSSLPAVFESSRITSRLLLEDLGLIEQWETISATVGPRADFAEAV